VPRSTATVRRVRAAVAAAVADPPVTGPIGVACSGGADSVAVADAAVATLGAGRVHLLHVDHGLHPASRAVADHVRALGDRLGVRCDVIAVTVARGPSLEDQARIARYAALEATAARLGLACVLAGHTARDQAETVLHRILRGTGPAGLAGIPARRGVHRRPLLALPRADTERYVADRGLPVVADPMNEDVRFARTRLRQIVLPVLAAENPRIDEALVRLAHAAGEWAQVIDALADPLVAAGRAGSLPAAALAAAGPAAAKRALQRLAPEPLDAEHLDAAWRLVEGPARGSRGVDLPGARLERVYGELVLRGHAAAPGPLAVAGPEPPYEIRRWRAGDRMRPRRLRGRSRKLSDLYGDAKLPRRQRAQARVVVRVRDGAIVWAEHVGPAHGVEIMVSLDPDR
jgi:tRNA(Ile)-lysidine synthase